MTRSTRWAAVWAMRRPAHDGQNPCCLLLEEPYELGNTRAVMIEGPSREALELVEVKALDGPQHPAV